MKISKLPKYNKCVIIIRMDRFDLEERITDYARASEEIIELLLYMIGDSPETPTEDELLNVLIGFQASQKYRYNQLWNTFEQLITNKTLKHEVKENA